MSTASKKRHTPEDLLTITDRPMPDLVDGQFVERGMGQKADAVGANICGLLGDYAVDHREGLVHGPQFGYQIFDDPDKVRVPSASFTLEEHLPPGYERHEHGRFRPDLVVEVIFPDTTEAYLRDKIEDFRTARVPWIWVVDPDDRTIRTYREGREESLRPGDTLDGGSILPGFACPVDELFE